MNTYSNKIKNNKKESVANAMQQSQNNKKEPFQFTDNRTTVITQRKLQEIIDNSSRIKQLKGVKENIDIVSENQDKKNIQRKITSVESDGSSVWYDDENLDLGMFSTKEKLVEEMRKFNTGTVPIFDITGKTTERLNELYSTKIYGYKRGPYSFNYTQLNQDGICRIDVTTPNEDEPVGYAVFKMETFESLLTPSADEYFTKAHLLGSVPKVAHLTHLYNNTLLRNGPNDIYNGFGAKLLNMVEKDAKGMGATIVYLEPASSEVRKEPNTNEKEIKNSISFYSKYGYGLDGGSVAHNWEKALADVEGMGLEKKDELTYARNQIKAVMEGMICKSI